MLCPACETENFPGSDVCGECGSDLSAVETRALDPVEKRLHEDRMKKAIKPNPLIVSPLDPVETVVSRMSEDGQNCALVAFENVLVGIFTERDVMRKLSADYDNLKGAPVRDFMTPAPESLEADTPLTFALNKMSVGGFRHVPVVNDEQQPLGVVSVKDVLAHIVANVPDLFQARS
ncbi:MAG: CBS domain-containing protein [Planctomycetes bacterium]|nr:CBS domain-containing protein [Planctomycetota bacterium]